MDLDLQYRRIGKNDPHDYTHIWAVSNVKLILNNPIYIGTLAQHRSTSVSYKNHKRVHDPSEWIVIENNHEPIVPRELWDKVCELEVSVSRELRQLFGSDVPMEKSAKYIQGIVDRATDAKFYYSDGCVGYLDVVIPVCIFVTLGTKVIRLLSKVCTPI